MKDKDELLAGHGSLGPDVVGSENTKLFNGEALEDGFDVFRVDVFPFVGDDHVFLAAEKMEMAFIIEPAEIAGHEPAIDDGRCGELGLAEVTGHDRLAANRDFTNALVVGGKDADFHAGERFADSIGAEGLQVVNGDGGAGFGEPVTIGDRYAQVVEELQRVGFAERAADNDGAKFPSEGS